MENKKYLCPMHPEVIADKPGSCSKCGMKLVSQNENSSMPCCSKHTVEVAAGVDEGRPKSFIKRYLYDLGKKDSERNMRKKGCC